MTSSDREILISINNQVYALTQRVTAIEAGMKEMQGRITKIEDTQAVILQNTDMLDRRIVRVEDKIDSLQTSVYWVFAVLAFVSAYVPIHLSLRNSAKEPSVPHYGFSLSDIRELIRLELSREGEKQ